MRRKLTCGSGTVIALLVLKGLPAQATAPRVVRWSPPNISSPQFESHAAFDPRNGDMVFVESDPTFSGWHLRTSQCTPNGWSAPVAPVFAAAGLEADPWFATDGNTLFFISTRSTDGIARKDLDIFRVRRDAAGHWQEPQRLPAPVNSTANEWFPRVAADGWMYFGSERLGGFGKNDIWRAHLGESGEWQVVNAGAALNTAGQEYEAELSPDGKRLILQADDKLFESWRSGAGWSKRSPLPAELNVNGTEIGAKFSPSGNSLLFSRDVKGKQSGEFFVWRIQGAESWPPTCAGR
jgi:hypothetical protein